MATEESIIRIPPYHYIHVLDQNSNVSRVEIGPKTYIRQDNERLVWGPRGQEGRIGLCPVHKLGWQGAFSCLLSPLGTGT
uniref:Major vault protein n=1 Tax=Marmota marmota marmota TaxID=9994 RepID=A0A8C5YPG6_MARMA